MPFTLPRCSCLLQASFLGWLGLAAGLVALVLPLPAQVNPEKAIFSGEGSLDYFNALAQKDRHTRQMMALSEKLPLAIYEMLARDHPKETAAGLAQNRAVPVALLERLADSDNPYVKWLLIKRPELPPVLRRKLVGDLAPTLSGRELGRLIEDRDAPPDYLDRCAAVPDPQLRGEAAGNSNLSLATLRALANDPVASVARVARRSLERRFPDDFKEISPSLVPLSQLNPVDTLFGLFRQTIETGDLPGFVRFVDYLDDAQLQEVDMPMLAPLVVKAGRTDMMDHFIRRGFGRNNPVLAQLAGACAADARWFDYFRRHDAFQPGSVGPALHGAVQSGDPANLKAVLSTGCDPNVLAHRLGTPLHFAVRAGDVAAIELLLAHGDRAAVTDFAGKTAVDEALTYMFLPALRLMKLTPAQRAVMDQFTREFPALDPKSPFPGYWGEEGPADQRLHLTLDRDPTGCFGRIRFVCPVLAWRATGPGEAEVYQMKENGEIVRPTYLLLRHDPGTDTITATRADGNARVLRRTAPPNKSGVGY